MDYGNILTRTWNIIWTHKYLIVLGVLAALGSSGSGFGGGGTSDFGSESTNGGSGFQFEGGAPMIDQIEGIGGVAIGVIVILVILGLGIGLIVWGVSRIASGGLISAASTIDGGGASSFALGWQAGWAKGWRLLGIGLVPLIPVLILVALSLGLGGFFYAFTPAVSNEMVAAPARTWPLFVMGGLACLLVPIAIILNLVRTFADRACMLEDLPVLTSYSRGWGVLSVNLGPALVFFLIQIAISLGLGIVLFLPNILMVLCCLLWPLFLLVQGAISAYFSTMWTLIWREWTGAGHASEIIPPGAPAR